VYYIFVSRGTNKIHFRYKKEVKMFQDLYDVIVVGANASQQQPLRRTWRSRLSNNEFTKHCPGCLVIPSYGGIAKGQIVRGSTRLVVILG
jgi:hypothetical protein